MFTSEITTMDNYTGAPGLPILKEYILESILIRIGQGGDEFGSWLNPRLLLVGGMP